MIIKNKTVLKDFEFWGGAQSNAKMLTESEWDILEDVFSDAYPDGIDATTLNDIFWHDIEQIIDILNLDGNEFFDRDSV